PAEARERSCRAERQDAQRRNVRPLLLGYVRGKYGGHDSECRGLACDLLPTIQQHDVVRSRLKVLHFDFAGRGVFNEESKLAFLAELHSEERAERLTRDSERRLLSLDNLIRLDLRDLCRLRPEEQEGAVGKGHQRKNDDADDG